MSDSDKLIKLQEEVIQLQKEYYIDMRNLVHSCQQMNAQLINLLLQHEQPLQGPVTEQPEEEKVPIDFATAMAGGEMQ